MTKYLLPLIALAAIASPVAAQAELETRVVAASFDEARGLWKVGLDDGEEIEGRFFILAGGAISVPKPPEIDGIERFRGACYHTGSWPHEPIDFSGQRVAVIGTGSSGVQTTTAIVDEVATALGEAARTVPILLVEQNLHVIRALADRVVVLSGGRVVFTGSAADLLDETGNLNHDTLNTTLDALLTQHRHWRRQVPAAAPTTDVGTGKITGDEPNSFTAAFKPRNG